MSGTYDLARIRKKRLAQLLHEKYDDKKIRLAEALGYSSSAYISRPFSQTNPRNIGDDLARRIENVAGLPSGWMDTPYAFDVGNAGISEPITMSHSPEPTTERVFIVGDTVNGPSDDMDSEIQQSNEWISVPNSTSAYGLRIRGSDLWPRLREGELLQVNPLAECKPGDMVALRTTEGAFLIRDLVAHHESESLLDPINGQGPRMSISDDETEWMHKIQAIMPSSLIEKQKT